MLFIELTVAKRERRKTHELKEGSKEGSEGVSESKMRLDSSGMRLFSEGRGGVEV